MQFVLVILQVPLATPIFFGIENHDQQDQGEKPKKITPAPERCREASAGGPSVPVLDLHENIDNPAVGSFRSSVCELNTVLANAGAQGHLQQLQFNANFGPQYQISLPVTRSNGMRRIDSRPLSLCID